MPKTIDYKNFAYDAAVEASSRSSVGFFIEAIDEGEGTFTYLFESKLKGYVGWRWSVTIYQGNDEGPATVSEVLLMPGAESLVAPDWVPWSERLADYKALQAELEAQAALDAEDAEDSDVEDSDDEDSDDNSVEVDEDELDVEQGIELELSVIDEPSEEESALANVEESVEAEAETGKTRKLPRFLRRRNRGAGKKKNE